MIVEHGPEVRRTIGTDLGIVQFLATDDRCLALAPLTEVTRSPSGSMSLGVLVTMVDHAASLPAMVGCAPDWTATQDISLHGARRITTGPAVVDCRLVRVGKKVVVVSAAAYDARGVDDLERLRSAIDGGTVPLAAAGLLTFARLPRRAAPGMDDYDPRQWVGQVRPTEPPAPGGAGSLRERMDLRVLDAGAGRVELARTPYVTNSIGTILGGVQAVMAEAAAEAVRPGCEAVDLQIHYLSQLRVGPARTVGTVLRDTADHSVVSVELVDAGNADHTLALATVTVAAG
jgi:acyl-coenzyme A thioesterase PaaI-like protein